MPIKERKIVHRNLSFIKKSSLSARSISSGVNDELVVSSFAPATDMISFLTSASDDLAMRPHVKSEWSLLIVYLYRNTLEKMQNILIAKWIRFLFPIFLIDNLIRSLWWYLLPFLTLSLSLFFYRQWWKNICFHFHCHPFSLHK